MRRPLSPNTTDEVTGLTRIVSGFNDGAGDEEQKLSMDMFSDITPTNEIGEQTQDEQQGRQEGTQGSGEENSQQTTREGEETQQEEGVQETSEQDAGAEGVGQGQGEQGQGESKEQSEEEKSGDFFEQLGGEQQQSQQQGDRRDYSQFPEEYHKALKQTSNDAFNLFKETWQETQRIKQEKAELESRSQTIYNHKDGYQLNPKVQNTLAQYQQVSQLESHYAEQQKLAQEGKPWTAYVADDNGQLQQRVIQPLVVKGEDGQDRIDPSEHLKFIYEEMGVIKGNKQQLLQAYEQARQEHIQSSEKVSTFLQEKEDALFRDFKELKKEDKAFVDSFKHALPSALQIDPLVPMMGKGLLLVKKQMEQIKSLQQEIAQLKGTKKEKELAGPSSDQVTSGEGSKGEGKGTLNLQDFADMGLPTM